MCMKIIDHAFAMVNIILPARNLTFAIYIETAHCTLLTIVVVVAFRPFPAITSAATNTVWKVVPTAKAGNLKWAGAFRSFSLCTMSKHWSSVLCSLNRASTLYGTPSPSSCAYLAGMWRAHASGVPNGKQAGEGRRLMQAACQTAGSVQRRARREAGGAPSTERGKCQWGSHPCICRVAIQFFRSTFA
jgi:hypothetical protein